MRLWRLGQLGSLAGGILCLVLFAALARREAHPGATPPPVSGQVDRNQSATSKPPESGRLDAVPSSSVPRDNDAAGRSAPEERKDAGSAESVGEFAWLQEHLQAGLVVEYATLLVAVVTALFGIFLA